MSGRYDDYRESEPRYVGQIQADIERYDGQYEYEDPEYCEGFEYYADQAYEGEYENRYEYADQNIYYVGQINHRDNSNQAGPREWPRMNNYGSLRREEIFRTPYQGARSAEEGGRSYYQRNEGRYPPGGYPTHYQQFRQNPRLFNPYYDQRGWSQGSNNNQPRPMAYGSQSGFNQRPGPGGEGNFQRGNYPPPRSEQNSTNSHMQTPQGPFMNQGGRYPPDISNHDRISSTSAPLPRSMTSQGRRSEPLNYSAAQPTAQGLSQEQQGPAGRYPQRLHDSTPPMPRSNGENQQ